VKHFSFEDHFGREIGELLWESEGGFVKSSLERCVFWSLKAYSPSE